MSHRSDVPAIVSVPRPSVDGIAYLLAADLVAVMLSSLFFAAIGAVVCWVVRPKPERDAAAAQSWSHFHRYAAASG